VVLGLVTGANCGQDAFLCDQTINSVAYGVLTVPAGALVGLAFSYTGKWETTSPDRLRVAIMPTRGGAAVRVSFGF
jgi:hypothetical protein